jgi:hypothetical protein
MLDARYWMLDTRCWSLVTGFWLLAAGHLSLATGCWLLVSGHWQNLILDAGCSILDENLNRLTFISSIEKRVSSIKW